MGIELADDADVGSARGGAHGEGSAVDQSLDADSFGRASTSAY
jgi:hypothetical protein